MERRNCEEIIQQMMAKIPADKKELLKDLEWNLEDAKYKAPEETIHWIRTGNTLERHIQKPKEDWEFEVLSIFTTRSIEELKKIVANE